MRYMLYTESIDAAALEEQGDSLTVIRQIKPTEKYARGIEMKICIWYTILWKII